MPRGQRQLWLGRLAEERLAEIIPPRVSVSVASRQNRWTPYARESIGNAFREWARLHDGQAPAKKDWSPERDPEALWPRPSGASFRRTVEELASEDNISLSWTAPHRSDPEHEARAEWHSASEQYEAAKQRGEDAVSWVNTGASNTCPRRAQIPAPTARSAFMARVADRLTCISGRMPSK